MGDVSVSLDLDAKALYNELQSAQQHLIEFASHAQQQGDKGGHGFVNSLKNAFSGVGDVFAGIKNAVTSAAGAIGVGLGIGVAVSEIKSVIEFGAHIEDLSRKTGVSAETLSRWGFAAEKAGTSIDSLSKFIGFLEINREKAARGDEKKIENFKNLGVSAEQVKDPLLSIDDILLKLSKSDLSALDLKAVGGKGALEVRQFLNEVGEGTVSLQRSLSDLDAKKLKEVSDAFIDLKQSLTTNLAPAIVQVFDSISDHVQIFVARVKEATVQLGALHAAAQTTNPGDFFAALKKGTEESNQIETDVQNKVFQDQLKRDQERRHPVAATSKKFSQLSEEDASETGTEEDVYDEDGNVVTKKPRKKKTETEQERIEREDREDNKDALDVIEEDTKSKLDRGEEDRQQREQDQKDADKDADDAKKRAIQDAADAQKEAVQKQFRDAKVDEHFAKNPAGLSLHDYASQGSGHVAALAQEAEREEKIAKQRQLVGDSKSALDHQDRAEQLKKSLGLPSKDDAKDATVKALNEAKVLKDIEKNTRDAKENL
jgi:hypothetical protein